MEIIVTPKKEAIKIDLKTGQQLKKKVCGYARVSTDLDDQKNSFDFQKQEFEERIKNNPDWEFVGMYADRGISGTQITHREEFKRMIKDAKAGKIDLILTKSVSRFARNTVDFLNTTRDLAALDISVYFEKENITTNRNNIDLVMTLFASLAESESRSISDNVKWGIRKRMSKNELKVPVKKLIGYSRTNDGVWYLNEDAPLVKNVFVYFLQGYTYRQIATKLKAEDTNHKHAWNPTLISRILRNEKYKGYVIHQKTVTIDVLTHKRIVNDGIEPKYTIKDHHPAIVSEDTFDYVQLLLSKNKGLTNESDHSNYYELAGLVVCEKCGRTLRKIKYPYNNEEMLTCKGRSKDSSNYLPCDSGVLPLNTIIKLTNKIVKDVQLDNPTTNSFVMSLINEASVETFMPKIEYYNRRIKETDKNISDLVKARITSEMNDYSDKFTRLKAERETLQNELEKIKELARQNYELKKQAKQIEFILKNNNDIDLHAVRSMIYRIIHRIDGSLTFVLKGPGFESIKEENIESAIKNAVPSPMSIFTDEDNVINYNTILLKGDANA